MHGRGLRLIRSLPFAHPCGALSISRPPDSLDSRRERSFWNSIEQSGEVAIIKKKEELLAVYPTCYACDNPRTSMAHAPPKCFFPEEKDNSGNYLSSKQLIKVPSCDEHTTKKSNDDVYALWHLDPL